MTELVDAMRLSEIKWDNLKQKGSWKTLTSSQTTEQ